MRPSIHPRLINHPFNDPGLYVSFLFEKRAFLFDIGDISALSAGDMIKITHVFVTHTHMDHFIGFDRLVRLLLGRDKELYIYGPQGFLKNIEGRLSGYCWNLVQNYQNRFVIHAVEVHPDQMITRRYVCSRRFVSDENSRFIPFSGVLYQEPGLTVSAEILDHGIPCLGFSLEERFHVNIKKDAVIELGLDVGPWLRDFKNCLFQEQDPNTIFQVPSCRKRAFRTFTLGELSDKIALITPGQKIAYFADIGYYPSNQSKMIALAKDADHLFIESAFLDQDSDIALKKHHLTARQAGTIAAKAGVKQFTLFHFSSRYTDSETDPETCFRREAETAFHRFIPK